MILVTGASGLLGANFILTGLERGREMVGTFHRHLIHIPGIRQVRLEMTDPAAVEEVISSLHPDWIVHCAAATGVDWCEDHLEACRAINAEATRFLVSAAGKEGIPVVYISTDAVYPGTEGSYREDFPPAPVNEYARSKLAGEMEVMEMPGEHLIIRTNIFGWNLQPKFSLAEWFLHGLESGKEMPGFTDVLFSPVLVNSLSEILLDLMDSRKSGLFNIGSRDSCSKYEFGRLIAEVFGLDPCLVRPAQLRDSPLRAPRPFITTLDTEKVSRTLNRPMPDVRSEVMRFRSLREQGIAGKLRASWGGGSG
jgi:dTDP-4-dehydrorhamnose reductase